MLMNKRLRMAAVVAALVSLLVVAPGTAGSEYSHYRAQVKEAVDSSRSYGGVEQDIVAEITHGPYQGQQRVFTNYYQADHPQLHYLQPGMNIILATQYRDGEIDTVFLQDLQRDRYLLYLAAVFVALLLIVGGGKGVRTLLTLGITGFLIFSVLLPGVLRGRDPVVLSTAVAAVVVVMILVIIGGFNKKSLAAVCGSLGGIFLAGVLALWFGDLLQLTGFTSEDAYSLAFHGGLDDLQGLLFGGIILGSLGAVTDVSMSIASAASEIWQNNQRVSSAGLFASAMNVGRDIMGTMANTLLLAYVGAAMPVLLLLLHWETQWLVIFNTDMMATEILRGMAGSLGLVATIPLTAAAAALLCPKLSSERTAD